MINRLDGYGKPGNTLVIIDSPSKTSLKSGRLLSSRQEKICKAVLVETGLADGGVFWTAAIPKFLLKPSTTHVVEWGQRLRDQIEEIKPRRILALGRIAHAMLIDRLDENPGSIASVKKVRGAMHEYNASDRKIPMITTVMPYQFLGTSGSPTDYWFRDFLRDCQKLNNQEKPQPEPAVELVIVENTNDLQKAFKRISRADAVSFDIETSGLNIGDHIESIGFGALSKGNKVIAVVIPYTLCRMVKQGSVYDRVRRLVKDFLTGKTYKGNIVTHNGQFDLRFVNKWLGETIDVPGFRDTQILHHLLDERPINNVTAPHGLKRLSSDYFDAVDYAFDWKKFWSKPLDDRDWQPLYKYLALDLYYTLRLYKKCLKEIREQMPLAVSLYENILCPASVALADIESQGIPVNPDMLIDLESALRQDLEHIEKSLNDLAAEHGYTKKLNPRSPKQLADVMFRVMEIAAITPYTGSTAANILEDIMFKHSAKMSKHQVRFIELIMEYRKMSKMMTTYAKPLAEQGKSGRIHAMFNLTGTATGRLSSQKPNLQNQPQMAGKSIRRCYEAPAGWAFIKADYSQLELRSAAHQSRDPNMIRAYLNERDIHTEVASAMFGIKPEEVTTAQRYAAKFVDFGLMYGRTAISIAEGPELRDYKWTVRQAQKFIDNYLAEFSRLGEWMKELQNSAKTEQELTTPFGRKRRWPLLVSHIAWRAERQALNFPVQSFASDITLNALVHIHRELKARKFRARIVAIVHDEIDLVCPGEELEEVCKMLKDIMENSCPIELLVPLKADVEVGPNWAEVRSYDPDVDNYVNYLKEPVL